MGQSCMHGRVPALCQSMEIHQKRVREGDGAGGEESGGWFTGRRLALEN